MFLHLKSSKCALRLGAVDDHRHEDPEQVVRVRVVDPRLRGDPALLDHVEQALVAVAEVARRAGLRQPARVAEDLPERQRRHVLAPLPAGGEERRDLRVDGEAAVVERLDDRGRVDRLRGAGGLRLRLRREREPAAVLGRAAVAAGAGAEDGAVAGDRVRVADDPRAAAPRVAVDLGREAVPVDRVLGRERARPVDARLVDEELPLGCREARLPRRRT